MKIFKVFLLFLISSPAFCFNGKKCYDDVLEPTIGGGIILSTTSYVSSFGPCKMIGQIDHDKKVFIAHNAEFLQIDIARGAGEYLHNFANISKCNESKLRPLLKKNYQRIFSNDELNPEVIYQTIDDVIRENNQTSDLCLVDVS